MLDTYIRQFIASQDALEVIGVTELLTYSSLTDLADETLVSEDAAHNSLQMSSSLVSDDEDHKSQ